jgi:hypothetical protein
MELILGEIDDLTVTLISKNGQEELNLFNGKSLLGLNTISLNVVGLPTGIYHISVNYKKEQKTKPFVISR